MRLLKKRIHFILGGLILLGAVSCDKDFNTIGANFVSQNNFNTDLFVGTEINAYSNRIAPGVQTNNLPVSLVGRYVDPVYGITDASAINQVSLSQYSPSFGDTPVVKQILITIPYFSTLIDTDETGASVFELDSVFGSEPNHLKLIRTGFFLRDFDPDVDFDDPQVYYSNEDFSGFDINTGPSIPSSVIYEDPMFFPSADEIEITEFNDDTGEDEVTQRLTPRLRVLFENPDPIDNPNPEAQAIMDYFQALIIDEAIQDNLISENAFQDYFRGIRIESTPATGNGHSMILDLDGASIEITYTFMTPDIGDNDNDGDTSELIEEDDTITLNFSTNRVNTFVNTFNPAILAEIPTSDSRLYLKGGEGSIGVIELFGTDDVDGNEVPDQLDQLRANNWLINEARLELYVDRALVQGGSSEPQRLYLYDLDNSAPLVDFFFNTAGATDEVAANHLGILQRDEFDKGIKYTMKLTEHIKNIINNDSTNVRLGLAVSAKVDDFSLAEIENATDPDIVEVPGPTVYSPRGTVLHSVNSENIEKRLKLQIYYTEED